MLRWTSSGRVKIERAKEHINNLDAEAKAFFEGNKYIVNPEFDPQSGHHIARLRGEPIPLRWNAIAADAVHNMRSALDILWLNVMAAPSRQRKVYFPIFDGAREFETRFSGVKEGSRMHRIVKVLRYIKPYKIGNDGLWHLNAIDARNKHENLTLTICMLGEIKVDASATYIKYGQPIPPGAKMRFIPSGGQRFVPAQEGAELFRFESDFPEMQMQTQTTFDIAFAKGEILEGEAVIPTLTQFLGIVGGIEKLFLNANLVS